MSENPRDILDRRDRWGNWEGANHPEKGKENGRCNRTACQRPLQDEREHQFMDGPFTGGPRLFYCAGCAHIFDRVDNDNRFRGASTLPNRIQREPKAGHGPRRALQDPGPDGLHRA